MAILHLQLKNGILLYLYLGFTYTCKISYTKEPTYNYRCVASSGTDVTLYHTDFPQCLLRCLRNQCRYVNHNSNNDQCELGYGKCEYLKADVGFMVNIFGLPRDDCLHWGSIDEPGRVPIQGYQGTRIIYAARIVSNNSLLLGKFHHPAFWANNKGVRIGPIYENDQDIEVLTKDDSCPLLWIEYTAGETLPVGAVAGGHLADGSVTYVAKITDGDQLFGYYSPKTEMAYYEMSGVRTASSMQIFLLL